MKTSSLLSFSIVAALLASSVAGCAATGEEIDSTGQELGQGIEVENPSGAYFARVSANGSGCPAGSYNADISQDGKAFTVTFSSYEATVDPGQALAVKDCTIAIDLRTPEGFSFSVSSFHYQGYALLDQDGMTAKQTAKYYFQGNPVSAVENRSDMRGPYDNSYVFSDQIGVADLVWSPCGASRQLNAQTRLVLQNNSGKTGTGYLNTTSIDSEIKTVFRFGLSWRQCGAGGDDSHVPIYRSFNPSIGDHLQTLTMGEGSPGWQHEGVSFQAFTSGGAGRQPLYRCRYNGGSHHFLSNDDRCEGHTSEGQLGFLDGAPRPGLATVYRCYLEGSADHLSTTNPDECRNAGFRVEHIQGYALP